ncbi:MAG: hypothetical protein JNL70_06010 [Saprospiraceae bacterium]|nr:hypothetical protein [Saprospiraceae bacterium]
MKINFLLTVFTTFIFFCCHDKVAKQPEANLTQIEEKKDSIPEMNLLDSEYKLRERLTDSVLKIMTPNVPTMNLNKLNRPFYKHMVGVFNGDSAILNLNFAHLTYDGKWAFAGTVFIPSKVRAYEVWGVKSDTAKFLDFYVSDKAEANFDNLFTMLGSFGDKNVLKGLILDNKTLIQGVFEFQETNTEGVTQFDLSECFVNKPYIDTKKLLKEDRKMSIVYTSSLPIAKPANKKDVLFFLNNHLKLNSNCEIHCDSFIIEGTKAIDVALKDLEEDEHLRNSEYSVVARNSIYWNNDDLVVIFKLFWSNTELDTYGGAGVSFETYDIKRKRKLTEKEVFKKSYDEEKFAEAIDNYFNLEARYDDKGKRELLLNMSNGFTSKGFYMVGKGNHGWYVSPVFIPYKVVEPFLRDDFKNQYWKK